jgi:RNA polymerase sigma-70 factor (ECF subfamily)
MTGSPGMTSSEAPAPLTVAGPDHRRRRDSPLDPESRAWIARLDPLSSDHEAGVAALHTLLLKAARFEVARRRRQLPHLRGNDYEDLAQQSADDALVGVLGKLDQFRGESRFTTWAYKFALFEAAAMIRKRAWQEREAPLEPEGWALIANDRTTPQQDAETRELLAELRQAIENELSPRQREVLIAATLDGVPIDVLADRLGTTRGALYKTIHDARRKLRAALVAHDGVPA